MTSLHLFFLLFYVRIKTIRLASPKTWRGLVRCHLDHNSPVRQENAWQPPTARWKQTFPSLFFFFEAISYSSLKLDYSSDLDHLEDYNRDISNKLCTIGCSNKANTHWTHRFSAHWTYPPPVKLLRHLHHQHLSGVNNTLIRRPEA